MTITEHGIEHAVITRSDESTGESRVAERSCSAADERRAAEISAVFCDEMRLRTQAVLRADVED